MENIDVKIAKNYLTEIELQRLNLLVSQFLDFAEFQALEQRAMTMNNWIAELDNQIVQNKRKLLEGKGKISHQGRYFRPPLPALPRAQRI